MDTHRVMYTFEHQILPQVFFAEKERMVLALVHDKKVLPKILDGLFNKAGTENPYTEDDFTVELLGVDRDHRMLYLDFPEPESEPLCYCSYLFFDLAFTELAYFCIEKAGTFSSGSDPFVCGWTEDGTHNNYGRCTWEGHNDVKRCLEIYKGMYGLWEGENAT